MPQNLLVKWFVINVFSPIIFLCNTQFSNLFKNKISQHRPRITFWPLQTVFFVTIHVKLRKTKARPYIPHVIWKYMILIFRSQAIKLKGAPSDIACRSDLLLH